MRYRSTILEHLSDRDLLELFIRNFNTSLLVTELARLIPEKELRKYILDKFGECYSGYQLQRILKDYEYTETESL